MKGVAMEKRPLQESIAALATEQRNPHTMQIDTATTGEILRLINAEDKLVAVAVEREIPAITTAVDLIVRSLASGGRLVYVGAGTSGRLAVVDAAECPPTFGTPPELVQALVAGGREAVFRAQEGAEDDEARALQDLDALHPGGDDVVCGVAASRRTPYVVAAVRHARARGARTIYVTTNPRTEFDLEVDVAICPVVGPEVIMGSTRMKSGTAQKLVLNMLTTAAMIRLGKVYENMMVDLQLTNEKLRERARRIVMLSTGVDYGRAGEALDSAGGHVKTALVMLKLGLSAAQARRRLEEAGGFVRRALTA
jgi:N-acetylmuramic acid 6-phosphate etherase